MFDERDLEYEEEEFEDVEFEESLPIEVEPPSNYATWDSENPFDLGMLD